MAFLARSARTALILIKDVSETGSWETMQRSRCSLDAMLDVYATTRLRQTTPSTGPRKVLDGFAGFTRVLKMTLRGFAGEHRHSVALLFLAKYRSSPPRLGSVCSVDVGRSRISAQSSAVYLPRAYFISGYVCLGLTNLF